ncbi:hypothetical protein GJ699_06065 [Duganella sp. FT80W]|uniref:Uncharacterized protein n=1 Tax=Duganella guangzhouensis TaxID=2666084 RepID=A0A6I2KU98_9BURK|nr:hypothetical protein [Duganella guangzhouensis]MRW89545.1 hypothetical protein [Duganella guangzhouensis]
MYSEQFAKAQEFTRSLGFDFPKMSAVSGELVTPSNGEKVMAQVKAAGITSLEDSALQCLKWSHALLPHVEAGLGCEVTLTVGQVHTGERAIFDPSQADFARWGKAGIGVNDFVDRQGFNFHAWYTLPNLEVLDLTLWSSLAVAWNKPELSGQVVGGWPDAIAPHPTYIPMVLGAEYVEHVHSISEVPLLSFEVSQRALSQLPTMLLKLKRN